MKLIPTFARPRHAWSLPVASCLALSLGVLGCNVFDPLDSPSGDAQLLSAARACFDRGDMGCAREMYGKLSANQSEVAASELAFVMLDEAGLGMGEFMTALGNGQAAPGLTKLAGHLSSSAGTVKRQAIYSAYLQINQIPTNRELRGLVRFVAGIGLAAEILAEQSGGDSILQKTDLTPTPTTCTLPVNLAAACAAGTAPSCDKPSKVIIGGPSQNYTIPTAGLSPSTAQPTWGQFKGAIDAVLLALNSELSSSGKFSSGTAGFAQVFAASPTTGVQGEECFQGLLLNQGVGI